MRKSFFILHVSSSSPYSYHYPHSYCVNAPAATATTTSTSSTPTGPVTPPGPTQSGIASNCNKYVMQQTGKLIPSKYFTPIQLTEHSDEGVYCADMANNVGITLTQLYTWNPALNGDCSGLWAGYAYCIGVSSASRRHMNRSWVA